MPFGPKQVSEIPAWARRTIINPTSLEWLQGEANQGRQTTKKQFEDHLRQVSADTPAATPNSPTSLPKWDAANESWYAWARRNGVQAQDPITPIGPVLGSAPGAGTPGWMGGIQEGTPQWTARFGDKTWQQIQDYEAANPQPVIFSPAGGGTTGPGVNWNSGFESWLKSNPSNPSNTSAAPPIVAQTPWGGNSWNTGTTQADTPYWMPKSATTGVNTLPGAVNPATPNPAVTTPGTTKAKASGFNALPFWSKNLIK